MVDTPGDLSEPDDQALPIEWGDLKNKSTLSPKTDPDDELYATQAGETIGV